MTKDLQNIIKMKKINSVSFFGAGNVAWHLSKMMYSKGIKIRYIYSRHLDNALKLAKETNATAINAIEDMGLDSDLYIFALSDNAITKAAEKFAQAGGRNKCVVHTAGMLNTDIFKTWYGCYGCFTPCKHLKKDNRCIIKTFRFLSPHREVISAMFFMISAIKYQTKLVISPMKREKYSILQPYLSTISPIICFPYQKIYWKKKIYNLIF